jgi:uncharacterized protein YjbI with pentapeptide repeats
MANPDHLNMLQQGVDAWNAWRERNRSITPDLSGANLARAHLSEANLNHAILSAADLSGANLFLAKLRVVNLSAANLSDADLREADLREADLAWANLSEANLYEARLSEANLYRADLRGADLRGANLSVAHLSEADLRGAGLIEADLAYASLADADIRDADLGAAELRGADLRGAELRGANLAYASLVDADIRDADLTGCRIYGVSAWGLKRSDKTNQQNLIITNTDEPEITVDNIEVAQFVYLLLHNEKIRDVIDTVGKKGVLLLGRFTEGRIAILERLRAELRKRGYVPIVFTFDKPETKDFTETIRLLAGLSHFVIADITNPKSAPLELQATVPEIMIPFVPIIEEGEKPFSMLVDLWIKHRDWVFEPLYYSSLDKLVGALDKEIIGPAEMRFDELVVRKAEMMKGKHV